MLIILLFFFFLFFHASAVAAAGPVERATRAAVDVLVGGSLTVSDDILLGVGGSACVVVYILARAVLFLTCGRRLCSWSMWSGVICRLVCSMLVRGPSRIWLAALLVDVVYFSAYCLLG